MDEEGTEQGMEKEKEGVNVKMVENGRKYVEK